MQNFIANEETESQQTLSQTNSETVKGQLGDPKYEVQQFMKNYAEAVRGGNLEEILSYYSDDIEAFDCPKIHYASEFNFPVVYQFVGQKVFADKKLATFSSLVCITGTAKQTDEEIESWFRLTCVLEKSQGYWQIAHDHLSIPFTMSDNSVDLISLNPIDLQTTH